MTESNHVGQGNRTGNGQSRDDSIEAAWSEEIKRRVDNVQSGHVKTIPGEQVLREIEEEFPDEQ